MDTRSPAQPPPASATQWVASAPVTTAIVAINMVVFLLAERSGSTLDTATLLRFGAAWRGAVWQGQPWRLVTSMFLHVGFVHLVWNQWFGFRLCAATERDLGRVRFAVLYLSSGVAAAAVSVIGHNAVSAGASGALFGLLGARYLRWRLALGSWRALWAHPDIRRDLGTVGVWFLVGLYANFDNYAHLGGLLFGAVAAWALLKWPGWQMAVAALLLAGLVAASLGPLPLLHR